MRRLIYSLKSMVLCTFIFALSTSSNAQIIKTASVEGITEYMLDNGMKVLIFPDNSAQTITVNITYKVGSRHEGYGEKGMAHLLEHMVFKGTPKHPNITEELTSHGARPNGTTYYDRTNYFETFNATEENLDWALDLESDRMMNSYISNDDLQSEFTVVRNEFESGENSPSRVLTKNVISAAYLWHNYGQSTIGNRSDIMRVPIENLKAFYKKYYRPDNAVLMVTGKIDVEPTLKLIVEKFGVLKNPATPLKDVPTIEPPQDGERTVVLNRVGDLQIVSTLYHIPAGSHIDFASIALAEQVLTDEPSGRLYKALVEGKKASSLYSYSPFTKEPSFLYINVDVPSDKSLDEAKETLLSVLDNLSKEPVTAAELKRAKANMLKRMDQISRNSSYLGTYTSEFIGAGDWRLMFIYRDYIESMTLDQVNAAVKRYLIKTNRTVGLFIPTENPVTVAIDHTEGLEELASNYKGREGLDAGDAFDVSYDNIQSNLSAGMLQKAPIEYGFIKKNNRGETVTLNFTIRNGTVDDFMNKGKIASYTGRMLNKGTTTKSRQDLEDVLSAIKSSVFVSSSNGRINGTVNTTEENLMATLDVMTDMLKNPVFDAAELEKLKTQDLAGLEQSKTEPQAIAIRKMSSIMSNMYPKGHPNHAMTLDEEIEAINSVTVADLKAYHEEFYGISDNASVIAIGNLDEQKLKDYFEANFSDFRNNRSFKNIQNPYRTNTATNESSKTPDKKNAISFGVLSMKVSKDDKDYAALQVAGEILGGGFISSRIANRLRQQDGVSYGAGGRVNVDNDFKDKRSSAFVYAIYAPENAAKVQQGFTEEIERFIKDGITKEELETTVNGWVQAQSVARAKDNELADLLETNLYYDRDLTFQKNIEVQVKSLTVDQVNTAIKKYFKTFDKWTVSNAGDFKELKVQKKGKKID